jgi:hypothetical protein
MIQAEKLHVWPVHPNARRQRHLSPRNCCIDLGTLGTYLPSLDTTSLICTPQKYWYRNSEAPSHMS